MQFIMGQIIIIIICSCSNIRYHYKLVQISSIRFHDILFIAFQNQRKSVHLIELKNRGFSLFIKYFNGSYLDIFNRINRWRKWNVDFQLCHNLDEFNGEVTINIDYVEKFSEIRVIFTGVSNKLSKVLMMIKYNFVNQF